MGIYHIPSQETRRWTGPYPGEYYGNLWKTYSVDLDRNEGVIELSRRFVKHATVPINYGITAFIRTDADCEERYWAVDHQLVGNNGHLIKTDSSSDPSPNLDWDTDGLANSPDSVKLGPLDFTVIGNDSRNDSGRNKLFVTTKDGDISVLNDTGNNTWTASWWVTKQGQIRLDSNVPYYPIEYFPLTKIGIVGDGNRLHAISRASDSQNDTVTNSRIVFPFQYVAYRIFTTTDRAWICCYNRNKRGDGAIIEWDGFSQTYNHIHPIPGNIVLSGIDNQGTPLVLSEKGAFYEYNGKGFSPMYRNGLQVAFPSYFEVGNSMEDSGASNVLWGKVSPRGMAVGEHNLIYIHAANPRLDSPRQNAGIWCLNPNTGRLYCKYNLTSSSDSGDTANDTNNYGYQSYGEPSAANNAGAIMAIPENVADIELLTSATVYEPSGLGLGIFLLQSAYLTSNHRADVNRGYFTTQFIHSDDIKEFWDSLWIMFKKIRQSSGQIVVKAKGKTSLVNRFLLPLVQINATWTSSTTFTVTLDATDDIIEVGDEIEVLNGSNAGRLAHIAQISGTQGGVQTITIDEVFPNTSGNSTIYYDRWKKLKTITNQSIIEDNINIGIDSSFIQFKVEMRGVPFTMGVKQLNFNSKSSINFK